MPTSTYEPIATTTLTGLQTTVTFTSIPGTYTDLRFVCSYKLGTSATGTNSFVRVGNGSIDTGSNYSYTYMIGTGSSTPSGAATNSNNMGVTVDVTNYYPIYNWDFMNYANTTNHKMMILRQSAGSNQVAAGIYLWRSNSAINQISFTAADNSGGSSGTPDQFAAGSTFTLYGIKAA